VEVIDLRIMVLWSIGFIANRHRIRPTKSACVRYWYSVQTLYDIFDSLGRYNYFAKVITNGHMKVKYFGLEITEATCSRNTYANYE